MTLHTICLLGITLLVGCLDAAPPALDDEIDATTDQGPYLDNAVLDLAQDATSPDLEVEVEAPDAQALDQALSDASRDEAGLSDPVDSPCPDDPIRGMVGAHMPDGRCYLIDARPVTMGEYWTAEQANGSLRSSSPHCDGFQSEGYRVAWIGGTAYDACAGDLYGSEDGQFQPSTSWPPEPEHELHTMMCIAWCDADAYCESVGKRLCASTAIQSWSIDGDDPNLPVHANATNSEWYSALTGGGTLPLPTALNPEGQGFVGLGMIPPEHTSGLHTMDEPGLHRALPNAELWGLLLAADLL
jgi:hypothetical protein